MKVLFVYDIGKDVDNIIATTDGYGNGHTPVQRLYIEKYGKHFERGLIKQFVEEYISTNNIDIEEKMAVFKKAWNTVEQRFIKRTEEMFNIQYPHETVTAFLTINNRCSYDIEQNYFFISTQAKSPSRTIMHELLHFYTWYAYGEELKAKGVPKTLYEDIKESLTVLLNIEYSDLMKSFEDKGYPKHKEMREKIQKLWLECRDLRKVINQLTSDYEEKR